MVRLEIKKEVNASAKTIFDILNDYTLETKWNPTVNEIEKIEEDKYSVKSTVGDITTNVIEREEYKKYSLSIKGGPFTKMGYIFEDRGASTEITGWAEFEEEKSRKMLEKAGDLLLKGLKNFAEYIAEGGDPDKFDKKQILVSP